MAWPRGEATACKAVYTGSNPVATSYDLQHGRLAQGLARFLDTEEVTGSIPVSPTEGQVGPVSFGRPAFSVPALRHPWAARLRPGHGQRQPAETVGWPGVPGAPGHPTLTAPVQTWVIPGIGPDRGPGHEFVPWLRSVTRTSAEMLAREGIVGPWFVRAMPKQNQPPQQPLRVCVSCPLHDADRGEASRAGRAPAGRGRACRAWCGSGRRPPPSGRAGSPRRAPG